MCCIHHLTKTLFTTITTIIIITTAETKVALSRCKCCRDTVKIKTNNHATGPIVVWHVMLITTMQLCYQLTQMQHTINTTCRINKKVKLLSYYYNCFTALWILSGTTRVSRYQKKHSPTHTYRGHQSSLICVLHLLRSMASSLFNLCA